MKIVALLVALFVILVGGVGLFSPDTLMAIGRSVVTPAGLYGIAALRVVFGIVLMQVAPISRMPRTLRVVGVVVIVAGLATPLFGVERTRAIMNWEATQGTMFLRGVAAFLMALGGFLAFAVRPGPKPEA